VQYERRRGRAAIGTKKVPQVQVLKVYIKLSLLCLWSSVRDNAKGATKEPIGKDLEVYNEVVALKAL